MSANGVVEPQGLEALIEDQICTRQPEGACYYEAKSGDQLSKAIHIFARAVDTTARTLGIESSLEKKARGCTKCGQRRVKMNQIL
jgi:hypothetical protein